MYFFEEVKSYLQFSPQDAERLVALRPSVEPHFGKVVESFYEALWQNPRTRAVFDGPEQVQRLRKSLYLWLEELFTGPFDASYFENRMRIGRAHVDVGLLPHFMFGAMNIVRLELLEAVETSEFEGQERLEAIQSVHKILDVELTMMLQSYWDYMMELKLKVPQALASGLAHEIRNPLNAIVLNLTLLERKMRSLDADGENSSIFDAMRNEVRRIQALTSEIMDFAKPIDIICGWHQIESLASDVRTVLGATFEAADVEFTTTVAGDPLIYCDIDRMKQVFFNLLSNALEAVEKGGKVELAFDGLESGTEIRVVDDGYGMPPSLKYRIFDLFYTNKASGTGLGLPIVRKIVEAHGGSMDVSSKEGQGTEFLIFLPRPRASSGALQ